MNDSRTAAPTLVSTACGETTHTDAAADLEYWHLDFKKLELTHYHEAGHAVAFRLHRFPPKRIAGPLGEHDRRSTTFARTRRELLSTPLARERAQDYAVCCIAGIAAESKLSGVPLTDLRHTSGLQDYKDVRKIFNHLVVSKMALYGFEVYPSQLQLWDPRPWQ